jgi:ribosomal protein L7/L12
LFLERGDQLTETFHCPTCGAPLEYAGTGESVPCDYCHNSVIVPAELRPAARATDGFRVEEIHSRDQIYQQLKEVAALAQAGQEIKAIKLYRQLTHCSLVEAKTAVESLRAGGPFQLAQIAREAHGELPADVALPSDVEAEIKRLIQANQKIEAIKLYRQKTGVGLKEAKDAVEAMDTEGQLKQPVNTVRGKLLKLGIALFFFGIASIFPLVFIPLGITAWQDNQIGALIGVIIAVAIWTVVWGGIGCMFLFW